MKKQFNVGALSIMLLVLLLPSVHAVAIGVNRASINFENVLRDGYAKSEVVVTTDSPETISAQVLLYGDEAAPWINFSARNFTFSRDAPYTLAVEASPPNDAQILQYRINMSILTGELARSDGGLLGTSTRASLGVPIFLTMTGTERLECQVGGLTVPDTERGQSLEVQMTLLNTGNVRVSPDVEIEIRDRFQAQLITKNKAGFGTSVLPTLSARRSVFFPLDIQSDQYWITVRIPQCGYVGVATFDMLDTGGVKDDGEFIRIDAPSYANTTEIVPISAVFRNKGVRSVRASFRGTITLIDTDTIAKVINSEQYLVDPGATANIETFFNPQEPGRYMITGKVFYNDKLTLERNAVLNVGGAAIEGTAFGWTTIILLALLLLIIFLLILIIRRKRRYSRTSSVLRR